MVSDELEERISTRRYVFARPCINPEKFIEQSFLRLGPHLLLDHTVLLHVSHPTEGVSDEGGSPRPNEIVRRRQTKKTAVEKEVEGRDEAGRVEGCLRAELEGQGKGGGSGDGLTARSEESEVDEGADYLLHEAK